MATGEVCQNRVMFKQFLMSGAMVQLYSKFFTAQLMVQPVVIFFQGVCQIDSARMAGVNEVIAVYLMAAKLGVPVSSLVPMM